MFKFMINFDPSEASSPDYVAVAVLKNFEPELPYLLAAINWAFLGPKSILKFSLNLFVRFF